MNVRRYAVVLLVIVFCSGCTAQRVTVRKTVMFAAVEDFRPGPEGGVDLVWSTGSIRDFETLRETLRKYDSLMPGQVWLVVDRKSSADLDDRQILNITDQMVRALKSRLGQGYKLVDTPDENTLRLSLALTNLETPNPILTVTNSLLPRNLGVSAVSRIVTGEDVRGGGVTAELLVSDARTNRPLVAVIDRLSDNSELVAMSNSPVVAQEVISRWVDRLWTTLSSWNWIKDRPVG